MSNENDQEKEGKIGETTWTRPSIKGLAKPFPCTPIRHHESTISTKRCRAGAYRHAAGRTTRSAHFRSHGLSSPWLRAALSQQVCPDQFLPSSEP